MEELQESASPASILEEAEDAPVPKPKLPHTIPVRPPAEPQRTTQGSRPTSASKFITPPERNATSASKFITPLERTCFVAQKEMPSSTGIFSEPSGEHLLGIFSEQLPPATVHHRLIVNDELEILEMIGAGSTCEVFRGRYRGQLVAVKQMSSRGPGLAVLREQRVLARELEVMRHLSSLQHPHLVHFIGCTEGRPARLVSELCAGGTVHELLHLSEHLELSWTQRLAICKQVAIAMAYLHESKPRVLHRDLKSSNVLLAAPIHDDRDEINIKVADFGIARLIDPEDQETRGDLTLNVGSGCWKAPEMLLMRQYDEKVDVYSYAIVLFEVVSLEQPFDDLDPHEFVKAITAGKRPDLDECAEPGTPDVLVRLIQEAWQQDPALRPSFAAILESFSLSGDT